MGQFQCYICEMTMDDEVKTKSHMEQMHNIKVEEEIVTQKYSCSHCSFTSTKMNDFKNHQIQIHKKEPHNWMVDEIRVVFNCDECDIVFPKKSSLEIHRHQVHYGDNATKTDNKTEIFPDVSFMTQNTADLKILLDSIQQEQLPYEPDVFEKDFLEILNSTPKEDVQDDMKSYKCDKCNFRSTTRRCLEAHIMFVHSEQIFSCNICPIKTRTQSALQYHVDTKHSAHSEVKETDTLEIKIELDTSNKEPERKYKCGHCVKTFFTDKGLDIHTGRVHKEQMLKKKTLFNCDNLKWTGKSQKLLDKHKIYLHIEQVKRKIIQEQPYKCYICGFMSINETAFKIHTEERHNQIYTIQRTN